MVANALAGDGVEFTEFPLCNIDEVRRPWITLQDQLMDFLGWSVGNTGAASDAMLNIADAYLTTDAGSAHDISIPKPIIREIPKIG